MALVTQDNRDWIEAPSINDVIWNRAEKELSNLLDKVIIDQLYQNGVLSKASIKSLDNHIGSFFFMDYPAPDTKNETQD